MNYSNNFILPRFLQFDTKKVKKFLNEKGALFFIELVNILKYQSRIIR